MKLFPAYERHNYVYIDVMHASADRVCDLLVAGLVVD
jgi:hypothetical protein